MERAVVGRPIDVAAEGVVLGTSSRAQEATPHVPPLSSHSVREN